MTATVITLTLSEVRLAALSGTDQVLRSWHDGGTERWGDDPDTVWQRAITGRIGELAVAKHEGIHWLGVDYDRRHLGDVADLEVRSTTRPNGCLITHEADPPERIYVLAITQRPARRRAPLTVRLAGWMAGADTRRPEWWRTDVQTPAWFVPQHALHPIEELPR
jgi:hypothetical protein